MKDVSSGFGTESLRTTLLKPGSGYTCNVDYKVFACSEVVNDYRKTTSTASARKFLFLTYTGLLRVLFVTKNNKPDKFIKWATETLFTVHMGTVDQKHKLAIINLDRI